VPGTACMALDLRRRGRVGAVARVPFEQSPPDRVRERLVQHRVDAADRGRGQALAELWMWRSCPTTDRQIVVHERQVVPAELFERESTDARHHVHTHVQLSVGTGLRARSRPGEPTIEEELPNTQPRWRHPCPGVEGGKKFGQRFFCVTPRNEPHALDLPPRSVGLASGVGDERPGEAAGRAAEGWTAASRHAGTTDRAALEDAATHGTTSTYPPRTTILGDRERSCGSSASMAVDNSPVDRADAADGGAVPELVGFPPEVVVEAVGMSAGEGVGGTFAEGVVGIGDVPTEPVVFDAGGGLVPPLACSGAG
jgi:hypothetical protein